MRNDFFYRTKDSFTLVELLVVIGILAILTAAVVIILNPAELLKQSRDSARMTDLASMQGAIQLLLAQNPVANLGNASTVYLSLADSSSTCGSYVLPALPAGYVYHCAVATSLTLADGQGWLPINFSSGSVQNLPKLPLDPNNTAPEGLFYTYMPTASGAYELTALIESDKYIRQAAGDGGFLTGVLQEGTGIDSTPFIRDKGLIGYWTFDDGSGAVVRDSSGRGNNGTLYGSSLWQLPTNCKRGGCLGFDGATNRISVPSSPLWNFTTRDLSVGAWVNLNNATTVQVIADFYPSGSGSSAFMYDSVNGFHFRIRPTSGSTTIAVAGGSAGTQAGTWQHMFVTRRNNEWQVYRDGAQIASSSNTLPVQNGSQLNIGYFADNSTYSNGIFDDVRIYSRALSAAEVQVIYNATK